MNQRRRVRASLIAAVGGATLGGAALVNALADRPALDRIPASRLTIQAVGRRLGQSRNPREVTALAQRASRVLAELTSAERFALGRGSIRFRVDRPVVVEVAVIQRADPPFWLADQGFQPTGEVHDAEGRPWALLARRFAAGPIGLGVNALDRSAGEHYAVFVRAADPGPSSPPDQPRLEAIGAEAITVRAAGRAVSPFADLDLPLVDLPDATAAGLVVPTRRADRADGALLPIGSAWKTRQPSSPRPDQVVASFGDDPARSLAVSWRTDPTTSASVARFVALPAQAEGARPAEFTGLVEPIASDGLLNDPVIHRHKVRADHLQPDTPYQYAVGDGSPEGWSPWYTTRTAALPGPGHDLTFLYLGDAQCELERWGELAHAAQRACPEARFLLLAGDLVDRGNERSNWDHFFLRGEGVLNTIPFLPAVGNHEYLDKGPRIYRGTFDLPRTGPAGIDSNLVYSFETGDAFVAVLDSNLALYSPEAAAAQGRWLDEALSRTRATWKFVTFHHPIYASHPTRANPQLGHAWVSIFDRHGVDLVLTGHDHAYQRTVPLRAGVPTADPSQGTTYVVAVSGEKFYGQAPQAYLARQISRRATYQTISLSSQERRLRYRSFDRDGREVDRLDIQKRPVPNGSPVADR